MRFSEKREKRERKWGLLFQCKNVYTGKYLYPTESVDINLVESSKKSRKNVHHFDHHLFSNDDYDKEEREMLSFTFCFNNKGKGSVGNGEERLKKVKDDNDDEHDEG